MKVRDFFYRFEYPVLVPKHQLAYWPVPKNACTSLKYAFYKLKTGEDFVPFKFKHKYLWHIHKIFPSRPFRLDLPNRYFKLAVVRNPVDRMVSTYCNRVLYHHDLKRHQHQLERQGLTAMPDFKTFVAQLEAYRAISKTIKDHTDSQVNFLGKDASYYDLVVNLKGLQTLAPALGLQMLELPRKQDGGGEYKRQVMALLDPQIEQKIKEFYQEDYQVFEAFF